MLSVKFQDDYFPYLRKGILIRLRTKQKFRQMFTNIHFLLLYRGTCIPTFITCIFSYFLYILHLFTLFKQQYTLYSNLLIEMDFKTRITSIQQ